MNLDHSIEDKYGSFEILSQEYSKSESTLRQIVFKKKESENKTEEKLNIEVVVYK